MTQNGRVHYRGQARTAGAILLFSQPNVQRRTLGAGGLDASPPRRSLAQWLFSRGTPELYQIKEVWATNRWALDFRTEYTEGDGDYNASLSTDEHPEYIAANFNFGYTSNSNYVRHALEPGMPEYTILALYEPIRQKFLGGYANWVKPFVQYSLESGQRFNG